MHETDRLNQALPAAPRTNRFHMTLCNLHLPNCAIEFVCGFAVRQSRYQESLSFER
jgi:hypothetical protein